MSSKSVFLTSWSRAIRALMAIGAWLFFAGCSPTCKKETYVTGMDALGEPILEDVCHCAACFVALPTFCWGTLGTSFLGFTCSDKSAMYAHTSLSQSNASEQLRDLGQEIAKVVRSNPALTIGTLPAVVSWSPFLEHLEAGRLQEVVITAEMVADAQTALDQLIEDPGGGARQGRQGHQLAHRPDGPQPGHHAGLVHNRAAAPGHGERRARGAMVPRGQKNKITDDERFTVMPGESIRVDDVDADFDLESVGGGHVTGTVTLSSSGGKAVTGLTGNLEYDTSSCPTYPIDGSITVTVDGEQRTVDFSDRCDGGGCSSSYYHGPEDFDSFATIEPYEGRCKE